MTSVFKNAEILLKLKVTATIARDNRSFDRIVV
jgi:hypothetical protein